MEEVWNEIDSQLNADKEPIEGINASYSFDLSGEDGGMYGLKFSNGEAKTFRSDPGVVDCALRMSVADFKKLLGGNLNSTAAYMTGKLKVKGNIGLALKLENVLKQYTL